MTLPEKIKEWWPLALLTGLLTAIGWFGSQIAQAAADPFWEHIAPAIPQKLLLSLCCLLLVVIAGLGIWVIYLHRVHRQPSTPDQAATSKAFHDQFVEPMDPRGFWKHKTKEGVFCPNCKMRHAESPLVVRPDRWICPNRDCKWTAANPDYEPPEPPMPQMTGRGCNL